MIELYFIFRINLPKPEVFCQYPKTIKVVLLLLSLTNYHQEQNISLLSIIIDKDLYKRRLFGYVILIDDKKTADSFTNPLKEALYIYIRIKLSAW